MGYIYMIQNKINKKVYVGQTKQKPQDRWKDHINIAKSNNSESKGISHAIHRAIRKYGIGNFDFCVLEEVDNDLLNQREIYWIQEKDSYHNGYNETLGGDAVQKYEYSPIYEDYLKTHNLQTTAIHFDCSRDTVRAAILSKGTTPKDINDFAHSRRKYDYCKLAEKYQELGGLQQVADYFGCDVKVVREACIENNIDIMSSGNRTREILGKPMQQIDLGTLSVIQSFPSASNAAIKVFNDKSKSRNILACCEHRQKTAYGYGWIYEGDKIPQNLSINEKYKRVVQKDKDSKEILNIFVSGAEAARSIGKGNSAASVILKVCKNPQLKTAYGYIWEYGDINDSQLCSK